MTTNTTTLFGFLPGKVAHYLFDERKPVLNDFLGDVLYTSAEEAEQFGRFMCTAPESKHKRVAIVRVIINAEVFNEIVSSGEMMPGPVNVLGFSGKLINPRACERLNQLATFQFDEIILEPDDEAEAPAIPRSKLH